LGRGTDTERSFTLANICMRITFCSCRDRQEQKEINFYFADNHGRGSGNVHAAGFARKLGDK
jgi:hypothetical protein